MLKLFDESNLIVCSGAKFVNFLIFLVEIVKETQRGYFGLNTDNAFSNFFVFII